MRKLKNSDWLPTTKKEVDQRGWEELDVILFSGDAYVDHPSFGAAVIGRVLEKQGLRVAIVPQPNWRDDLRDFKKLGAPKLFFGISAGSMDSMVNHYTANKRLRSDDAYTPDGRSDMRPDYPTIVYSQILTQLFPQTPIVIGSIEASMRRLTHYDYWQDCLRKSILVDSGADLLIYGMGELPIIELCAQLVAGKAFNTLTTIPQTAFLIDTLPAANAEKTILLHAHEACLKEKLKQAQNFKYIEEESNKMEASILIQPVDGRFVQVNPPYPPMSEAQIDASFDLPYTRLPHPKYKEKRIPAFEMIRFSVNIHRGCFGGCAFCTISAHQGKFIASRSKNSILNEVKQIVEMPDFKGYLSDLGGPSANMYQMKGVDPSICKKCKRPSCIFPRICANLNTDHGPLLDIYQAVDQINGIKKSFIGSGVRYDLLQHDSKNPIVNRNAAKYTKELIQNHVSGRLKVAPEHTSDRVLSTMRKPSFAQFQTFKQTFERINRELGMNQQLIPYFISSHPNCTEEEMAELAVITKNMNFKLEQVQDFTPTPLTMATEAYYTGLDPYTLTPIYAAKTAPQKLAQKQFFFWYQKEYRNQLINELRKMNRKDLIDKLFGQ